MRHIVYNVRYSVAQINPSLNHNIILLGYKDTKYSVPLRYNQFELYIR